jgi:hypothetical protein
MSSPSSSVGGSIGQTTDLGGCPLQQCNSRTGASQLWNEVLWGRSDRETKRSGEIFSRSDRLKTNVERLARTAGWPGGRDMRTWIKRAVGWIGEELHPSRVAFVMEAIRSVKSLCERYVLLALEQIRNYSFLRLLCCGRFSLCFATIDGCFVFCRPIVCIPLFYGDVQINLT